MSHTPLSEKMTTAAASPLESLPLETLLRIFALNFTNPDDQCVKGLLTLLILLK
jgi:hypothetical protein